MIELGTSYDSAACCSPESSSKKGKKRIDYPTLYIRGKDLPPMPDGEFMFTAKGKVVGVRKPVDGDSEQSIEIAVIAMEPGEKVASKKKQMTSVDGLEKELAKKAGEVVEDEDDGDDE